MISLGENFYATFGRRDFNLSEGTYPRNTSIIYYPYLTKR